MRDRAVKFYDPVMMSDKSPIIQSTSIPQSVWVCSSELSVDVLLELSHIEHPEGFLNVHEALGELHHVVADGAVLGRVLDEHLAAAESLEQDVAALVHLHLGSVADQFFEFLSFRVPHGI